MIRCHLGEGNQLKRDGMMWDLIKDIEMGQGGLGLGCKYGQGLLQTRLVLL